MPTHTHKQNKKTNKWKVIEEDEMGASCVLQSMFTLQKEQQGRTAQKPFWLSEFH